MFSFFVYILLQYMSISLLTKLKHNYKRTIIYVMPSLNKYGLVSLQPLFYVFVFVY